MSDEAGKLQEPGETEPPVTSGEDQRRVQPAGAWQRFFGPLVFPRKHPRTYLVLGLIALIAVLALVFSRRKQGLMLPEQSIRAPSAIAQGSYAVVLDTIVKRINADQKALGWTIRQEYGGDSIGSQSTRDLLLNGKINLGILQSNTAGRSNQLRAIAFVFTEYYLLFTRTGATSTRELARDIENAPKKYRLGGLGEGSQSKFDVKRIVAHAGFNEQKFEYVEFSSYMALADELLAGKLDGGLLTTGLMSQAVQKLGHSKDVHLVNYDSVDGLVLDWELVGKDTLHAGVLSMEQKEITMPVTKAMLATRDDVSGAMIYDLTKAIFSIKTDLAKEMPHLKVEKIEGHDDMVHPGALQFYTGQPGWLVLHKDEMVVICALIGLVVSSLSLVVAFLGYRQKKVEQAAPAAATATVG